MVLDSPPPTYTQAVGNQTPTVAERNQENSPWTSLINVDFSVAVQALKKTGNRVNLLVQKRLNSGNYDPNLILVELYKVSKLSYMLNTQNFHIN